jgi:acyl carrier protein
MNLYGPTEATIDVSYFDCSTGEDLDKIPIGKPIDNIQLYVIDKNNKLQPIGIPGELCIAGVGLARGYLNNSKLTAEKFVDNPFESGTKMYKTGDLAKWLSDGNIEYLGRIDRQIKIRGFRIELGEIETVLLQHENIKEVCVTVDKEKDMTGNDRLKAYVVAKDKLNIAVESLRSYLKEKLPEYMVPSTFVNIDSIPVTAHGKADIKALQASEAKVINISDSNIKADTNSTVNTKEKDSDIKGVVTAVYKEMLQLSEVDSRANFFDLGGHSLLLVKAAMRLKELLDRDITTVDMFQYTTIDSLSQHLSQGMKQESKEASKKDTFAKSKQKARRQRDILMKLNQSY